MTKQNRFANPKNKKQKKNTKKIVRKKYQPKHKQSINQSFGFKKSAFIKIQKTTNGIQQQLKYH